MYLFSSKPSHPKQIVEFDHCLLMFCDFSSSVCRFACENRGCPVRGFVGNSESEHGVLGFSPEIGSFTVLRIMNTYKSVKITAPLSVLLFFVCLFNL